MATPASGTAPNTIVLIHGFWVTPRSWEHWKQHYEAKGFTVLTPAYPGFEVEVEALRADPTPIEQLEVSEIIGMLETLIGEPRPPADHHGSLGWRSVHPDPARPRIRCGGGGDQLGPDRGREGDPAVPDQVFVSRPEEPREPASSGRPDPGAVVLRVREHVQRGGVPRDSTSGTTSPPPARSSGEARSRTSTPARTTRTSTTTTTPGRRSCSSQGRTTRCSRPRWVTRTSSTTSRDTVTEIVEYDGPHFLPAVPEWEAIADFALDWALKHATSR